MATKKYLSLDGLQEYDALIKANINSGDESVKAYVDTKTSGMATSDDVDDKIIAHNSSTSAHSDMRQSISELELHFQTILDAIDSDDVTLDQLSEIVEYIKENRDLIDAITTSKVSVSDIVNDVATKDSTKVLSAEMGYYLKTLIDDLSEQANTIATIANSKVDTLSDLGITATATELNYMKGVTSEVQTQLNAKQNALIGTEGQIVRFNANGVPVAVDLQTITNDIVLITVDDINTICGANIQYASMDEVTF